VLPKSFDEALEVGAASVPDAVAGTDDEQVTVPGEDGLRYTDKGNATRLIRKHGDVLRFVPVWHRWLVYANGRWRLDHASTLVAHLAAGLGNDILTPENIRKAKSEPDDAERKKRVARLIGWGTRTENRTGVQGTLDAAATVPGVALDHEAIDAHPWLLNVANGTVNLRTGTLGPHDPNDLLMMMSPVIYDQEATCPQFEQFLELVLPDDEVRRFVQRLFGLALVGEQVEHVLPIAIGGGANGKSTLTKIIAAVFGEYGIPCSKDILLALRNTVHPTSKATLFRRRLAYAGELPPDAALNEAQVKELTGGDRVTARRMREDEWSFDPSHTLWLHANYRPKISGTDDGIWRRVKLIPFEVQVPAAQQDPDLARRIIAEELSGVLNWLLSGLAEYRRGGLATPERVKVATATYRNESDTVAAFLAEVGLVIDPRLATSTGDLLQLHNEWFTAYGIGDTEKGHYQQVVEALKVRGVTSARTGSRGRFWRGIGRGGDNP
jgi:putative DNA primase/helicase